MTGPMMSSTLDTASPLPLLSNKRLLRNGRGPLVANLSSPRQVYIVKRSLRWSVRYAWLYNPPATVSRTAESFASQIA